VATCEIEAELRQEKNRGVTCELNRGRRLESHVSDKDWTRDSSAPGGPRAAAGGHLKCTAISLCAGEHHLFTQRVGGARMKKENKEKKRELHHKSFLHTWDVEIQNVIFFLSFSVCMILQQVHIITESNVIAFVWTAVVVYRLSFVTHRPSRDRLSISPSFFSFLCVSISSLEDNAEWSSDPRETDQVTSITMATLASFPSINIWEQGAFSSAGVAGEKNKFRVCSQTRNDCKI